MSRPDMAVFEAYRRHYETQMPPADAKALALAEAQYEADEREAIKEEQ